ACLMYLYLKISHQKNQSVLFFLVLTSSFPGWYGKWRRQEKRFKLNYLRHHFPRMTSNFAYFKTMQKAG
ncbi:hypothetical protein MAY65_23000, partial [Escherichia coli]